MRVRLDWLRGMPSQVIAGNVVAGGAVHPGWVALRDGLIAGVGDGPVPAGCGAPVELGDLLIAPGFVDVHVHGGAGGQAAGDDPADVADQVLRAARFHAAHGTTCLVATTVSDTPPRLRATAAGVRIAMDAAAHDGAVVAGLHLEGPWLAPGRCGAHDPSTVRRPDQIEFAELLDAAGGAVRLVTLAPELDGAPALIAAASARGVVVSVGHTDATYAQARVAFDAGARHLTHLGNAMRGIDRREPGPIVAALNDERVTVEVIADGHHVHPALMRLAAIAAPGRLVAVTDAISATGLPDGEHRVGELPVFVRDGRAVLADQPETLAGSVLTMDRAVASLVAAGVEPVDAIRAATATPARVLGDERSRGVLAVGARADLVVLDGGYAARATVIGGRVVHDPGGLLRAMA
jgi:N-acetylglucosamine-6-phosphate deacetylase